MTSTSGFLLSSSSDDGVSLSQRTTSMIFAIANPITYGFVNTIDKTIVSRRVHHTSSYVILVGIVDAIIGLCFLGFGDWSHDKISKLKWYDFFLPIVSGICCGMCSLLYFFAMEWAEASKVVGTEAVYPLFVVVWSLIFLSEKISGLSYIGIGLSIIGGVILSMDGIKMLYSKVLQRFDSCAVRREKFFAEEKLKEEQAKKEEQEKMVNKDYGDCWYPFKEKFKKDSDKTAPAGEEVEDDEGKGGIVSIEMTSRTKGKGSDLKGDEGKRSSKKSKGKHKKSSPDVVNDDVVADDEGEAVSERMSIDFMAPSKSKSKSKSKAKSNSSKQHKKSELNGNEKSSTADSSAKKSSKGKKEYSSDETKKSRKHRHHKRDTESDDDDDDDEDYYEEEHHHHHHHKHHQPKRKMITSDDDDDDDEEGKTKSKRHKSKKSSKKTVEESINDDDDDDELSPVPSDSSSSSSSSSDEGTSEIVKRVPPPPPSSVEERPPRDDNDESSSSSSSSDEEDDVQPSESDSDSSSSSSTTTSSSDCSDTSDSENETTYPETPTKKKKKASPPKRESTGEDKEGEGKAKKSSKKSSKKVIEEESSSSEDEESVSIDVNDEDTNEEKKEEVSKWRQIRRIVLGLLPLPIFLSGNDFFAKLSVDGLDSNNVTGFNSIGLGIVLSMMAIKSESRKYFMSEFKYNIFFCIFNELLTVMANYFMILGMVGLEAPIVSALSATRPLFVLILETILRISKVPVTQCLGFKLFPIICIIGGAILMTVAS